MKRFGPRIAWYIFQAVLPYFIYSWLILSVVLFVQQASRYADIFFSTSIPQNLIWQLTIALVPNVIAFTCPMATLVGIIIGLSRLQSDSELTAARAAGIGNLQMMLPVVFLGLLLAVFTFLINLYGVPFAARLVHRVALQSAIYKLESPIEPGVFNTETNGYTIYIKDGDFTNGTWKNIFIYKEEKQRNLSRLITSRSGKIDVSGGISELVLEDAVVTTISSDINQPKFASENFGQLRFGIKTKRDEAVERISSSELSPEELGLTELTKYAAAKEGRDRTEAQILWQRRILLSVTPIIFAFLGTALVLRFNRGGRGFSIFLALLSLVAYYLTALLGEQLARTNQISVRLAGLLPVVASGFIIVWFYLSNKLRLYQSSLRISGKNLKIPRIKFALFSRQKTYNGLGRILDLNIVLNLAKYFLLTFVFLASVHLIFTAFDLWKFAGEIDGGLLLLIKYLTYILPAVYLQLAPAALMIATLATFVIKSRQNEIVAWTAAGQSVYRLLFPCFVLMIGIGFINLGIQEKILPATSRVQDELRAQIRSRGVLAGSEGKVWVANDKRIYSFELTSEKRDQSQKIKNLAVYEFSEDQPKMQTIYKVAEAVWEKNKIKFIGLAEKTVLVDGKVETAQIPNSEIAENSNPFNNYFKKPNHINIQETKEQIRDSESEAEKRVFEVALEKKYATLFLPFVITLFTAPFALTLSRKGKVVTVGFAVGFWLIFVAIATAFEQFGINGYISPKFAVWSPPVLFSFIGIFLLSKIRT